MKALKLFIVMLAFVPVLVSCTNSSKKANMEQNVPAVLQGSAIAHDYDEKTTNFPVVLTHTSGF